MQSLDLFKMTQLQLENRLC